MFEGIVKGLIKTWQGKREGVVGPFLIADSVWKEMDTLVENSQELIPALYGKRMPRFTRLGDWTAEDYSSFILYIAPIVMLDRWDDNRYYLHLVELSNIVKRCLAFDVAENELVLGGSLRMRIAQWVVEYEE